MGFISLIRFLLQPLFSWSFRVLLMYLTFSLISLYLMMSAFNIPRHLWFFSMFKNFPDLVILFLVIHLFPLTIKCISNIYSNILVVYSYGFISGFSSSFFIFCLLSSSNTLILLLFEFFPTSVNRWFTHWNVSDSKFLQVSRTFSQYSCRSQKIL